MAFVAGGIVTFLISLVVCGFGQAQAGMSAGPTQSNGPSDFITISMICGFFFVSAYGIAVSKTKSGLWFWAILGHALLAIDYIMLALSMKRNDPDGYEWPSQARNLAIIMAVYFAPWVFIWTMILTNKWRKIMNLHWTID